MKTTFYVIGLLTFSAIMLSPRFPKEYPSAEVMKQRMDMKAKEKNLDKLISQVEYNLEANKIINEEENRLAKKNKK